MASPRRVISAVERLMPSVRACSAPPEPVRRSASVDSESPNAVAAVRTETASASIAPCSFVLSNTREPSFWNATPSCDSARMEPVPSPRSTPSAERRRLSMLTVAVSPCRTASRAVALLMALLDSLYASTRPLRAEVRLVLSRATLTRTSLARFDSLSVTPWMASEIVLFGRVMAMPLTDNCASRAALV